MARKTAFVIIILFTLGLFLQQASAKGNRNSGRKKPKWTPTSWQTSLPPISVEVNGKNKEFSFVTLIKADGYLCPGSARAYKSLNIAFPILYDNSVAVAGDFEIRYGPSNCTKKVYDYFGRKAKVKNDVISDKSLKGMEIVIKRKSTGKKVAFRYDSPAANRHNPAGAAAGTKILKAENGSGMYVRVFE